MRGPKLAKKTESRLQDLRTEQLNSAANDLDCKSSLEIVRIINAEDKNVAGAVERVLPQIAHAVDLAVASLRRGGRLIYVGAGTSGRIAALDASECKPTFNTDRVQYIIAGGAKALGEESEISEDDTKLGRDEIKRRRVGRRDVVIGIASSGRTPFTVSALEAARRHGAQTIALTCNRDSPLERAAHFAIITQVGPEVLAGSSRMKAATAHKMVLNMISTAAMSRLGFVYGQFMVKVVPKNSKLRQRAVSILEQTAGVDQQTAAETLKSSHDRTPVALVMLSADVSRGRAVDALKKSSGNVRQAIQFAREQ